jgi:hypothetical protein
MEPIQDTTASGPMADVARIADLRLEQWYQARGLELPPDTRAGFTAMAFEAIARHPERDADAVMDDLIAELDQRLGRVQALHAPEPSLTRSGSRRTLMQRLKRRFRK